MPGPEYEYDDGKLSLNEMSALKETANSVSVKATKPQYKKDNVKKITWQRLDDHLSISYLYVFLNVFC